MRVLVVEDEVEVGRVFVDYLREFGHQPWLVPSAEVALDQLEAERPDAILLDIRLPGMSGAEFLAVPDVRDARIPIIVVSGVATERQVWGCLRLGAVDFLAKPVSPERLRTALGMLETRIPAGLSAPAGGARVQLQFAVGIAIEWRGTCVALDPRNLKIRSDAALPEGAGVRLTCMLPDGLPALVVEATVTRVDPDGHVFSLHDLSDAERQRLRDLLRGQYRGR